MEVVGLLHHELGELQVWLRVVDLELEVRHGALAHGPLKLGRVHVGVRVPELVGVHAAAAEVAFWVSFTTFQRPRSPPP